MTVCTFNSTSFRAPSSVLLKMPNVVSTAALCAVPKYSGRRLLITSSMWWEQQTAKPNGSRHVAEWIHWCDAAKIILGPKTQMSILVLGEGHACTQLTACGIADIGNQADPGGNPATRRHADEEDSVQTSASQHESRKSHFLKKRARPRDVRRSRGTVC
ncbi:hypothetical protein BN2476_360066 [Paraburkholderia piptadeniae]|uniref:Uncharacterized protein n=1 Tax=Paraburkholderia piptadeniae TaxID=1701573 RepID=A0A1N7S9C1_9BURK|nr:hypothetical protein BN2476_360066 [Paraburkholderia piptadeniae]